MRKWHLKKVGGEKKTTQHLPVFKQNCLQETDLKGSCWHISYVVEKTDIISNAFEYCMQRKGLKVSLSSTRVFLNAVSRILYIKPPAMGSPTVFSSHEWVHFPPLH